MPACITPFFVKQKIENRTIPVPCGKCPVCLAKRISGWSFRLMQQAKISNSALFITLTYDTIHVPITRNGFMDIRKRDLQLFFKRLRKAHKDPDAQIKYYAVGEYGGKSKRPHYHVILFNAELELIQPAWIDPETKKYLGQIHYGTLTEASAGYTLKYMSKPSKIPLHRNDDRTPEFSLMSKGLGANYLTPQMEKWHKADLENRMYVNVDGGKKVSMPRYYKNRVYTEDQRKRIGEKQQLKIIEETDKQIKAAGSEENYWRNISEAHLAAFKRQKLKSEQDRNTI